MATSPFQYDLYRLAVGVLYINLGRANPVFPTTTRAHPSWEVFITPVAPLGALCEQHALMFPFKVRWDIWNNIVVPLFAEGSTLVKLMGGTDGNLRNTLNQEMLRVDLEGLLDKIMKALRGGLEAQGYTPPSIGKTGYVEEVDGPLVYATEDELVATAHEAAVEEQEEAVWEDSIENGVPTDPVYLRLDLTIPVASPPPVVPSGPTQQNTVLVVSASVGAGEPVARTGTVTQEYVQFDE
jgi:hypothetical protein